MRINISKRLISTNLIIALTVILLFGCSKKKVPARTLVYFRQNLNAQMDSDDIEDTFGEYEKSDYPELSVYKYRFVDSTQVWIGYTTKVVYACLIDKNHNFVEDLVSTEQPPTSGL